MSDILKTWYATGAARKWVQARNGVWSEDEWYALLHRLQRLGPVGPAELAEALQRVVCEPGETAAWVATGEPARWVEARGGRWDHADWLNLLASLRAGRFATMLPQQVAAGLETARRRRIHLHRVEASGFLRLWVALQNGEWSHDAWADLLARLASESPDGIDAEMVGGLVERHKARHLRLRAWVADGGPRRWVESRHGNWDHTAWLGLLGEVTRRYGEVDADAVGLALEDAKRRWLALERVVRNGELRLWVEVRRGEWSAREYRELAERVTGVDAAALAAAVEALRVEYGRRRRQAEGGMERMTFPAVRLAA